MNKVLNLIAALTCLVSFNGFASEHHHHQQQQSDQVQVGVDSDSTHYYDTREGSYVGMITNHCDQLSSGINEDCVEAIPITNEYCDARFSEDCF